MTTTDMPSTSLMVDLKANHNVQGVTLCAVFLSLSLISTLARLASRTSKSDGLKADEALLIVSWVLIILVRQLNED